MPWWRWRDLDEFDDGERVWLQEICMLVVVDEWPRMVVMMVVEVVVMVVVDVEHCAVGGEKRKV